MKTNTGSMVGMAVAAAIAALAMPTPAPAQAPAPRAELEEITITARKREESIQDAPLTIQAFSGTQLEDRGVGNIVDLAKFTPGITVNTGTSRASADYSVRGMTQSYAPGDNRRDLVTVFIDGVPYLGNPSTLGAEDMQRVEVIKGPQSALFGRATFGGAINMVTTTPGQELKGRVSGTAAQYGDYRVLGSLEGPIVPGLLSGRLLVQGSEFDGFYKNALGGRLGESKQRYYAGTLNFTPTENFSVKVRYGYRDDEDGEAATPLVARWPEHNCGPFPGYQTRALTGLPAGFTLDQSRKAFCGEIKAPSGPIGINTVTPAASTGRIPFTEHGLRLNHDLLSGSVNWSFLGGYALNAIASTQNQNIKLLADFERTPEDRYQAFSDIDQAQKTYELRLTSPASQRIQWMLGVARLEADWISRGGFINGALFGATAGGPTSFSNNANSSKTDSVFGSLGFDVTDALNVSVEARRQKDTITSGLGTPVVVSVDTNATLPRVLLRYKLSEENNLYANYAKGNQPTQTFGTYYLLTPAQQTVASANGVNPAAPEAIVKNYEIGLKHRAPGGAWYANASIYYLEWVGRQGLRTFQVDLDGNGVIDVRPAPAGEVFNAVPFAAGDSNTKGVEIDGAVSLLEHWTLGGSFSYADTTITKALNEPIPLRLYGRTDSKGYQFPGVPKTSGAVFGQYEAAWTDDRRWFARADVTYIGKRYDTIANLAWVPNQVRTNLRGGVRTDRWSVEAFVNNLFDDKTLEATRYNSDSAADPFFFQLYASEAVLPHKRQFGVTASFRF